MNREMRVTCLYISSHVLMSKFIVGSVYMTKGSNIGGSKLSSTSTIISLGPQLPPSFFLYFTVFNLYFSYLKIQWILSSGSHYCNSSRNKKKAMLKMNLLPVLNKDSVGDSNSHLYEEEWISNPASQGARTNQLQVENVQKNVASVLKMYSNFLGGQSSLNNIIR